jgi:hypothetical protein
VNAQHVWFGYCGNSMQNKFGQSELDKTALHQSSLANSLMSIIVTCKHTLILHLIDMDSSGCSHEILFAGMCAYCGANVLDQYP